MTKSKITVFALFSLMLVLFISCASEELTSAKLYIQQQDWDNAETYLVKALAVEPENPEIPYLLGDLIYGRKMEWSKMNEMFDKALSLGSDKTILQGGTVSDYVAQAREKHWVTIYNKGISYFNEFRKSGEGNDSPILQNAIASFKTATEVNPNSGQSYGILANCLFASGDLEGALEAVTIGASEDPENFDLTMTAGKMFIAVANTEAINFNIIKLGMSEKEITNIVGKPSRKNKDVGDWGEQEQWVYSNGNLYFENGNLKSWQEQDTSMEYREKALIYYKRAVGIDPTNSLARRQLAQTYYDLGDKEESLAVYKSAIDNETDLAEKANLYYNLGVLNMQLGDYQQAEDNFSLAYDYNPNDIDALRGIAQTFENAEKWSRAEYFYRKLIDIEPENPQHYRAMARVLLRQGDTDRAQEYFDKSKEL